MKKTAAIIISLCVVFSFFITAFAANNNISVDELNLTVSIPDIYYVVTRSTDADDPVFDTLEMTKAELMSKFEKSNVYLNAFCIDSNEEIVINMDTISINDLNSFSDSYLNDYASSFIDEYEDFGISILDYEIYQHKQMNFIKIHFYYGLLSAYGMQYYTVYDNQAINFTLYSYAGDISSAQKLRIRSVVDSITFDTTPQSKDETEEFEYIEPSEEYTEPFIYIDDKTGVEFTVPSDWCEKPLSQERKYIDVKFASTKQHDMIIMFGSADLWSELPSSYKSGLSRSDFDNSCLSMSDISEMLGIDPTENYKKTYNGIDYYQIEFSTSVDLLGTEISVTITEMVRIQNGWMYTFQFSGTEDSEYFSDFESLMNSVTYKSADSAQVPGATDVSSSETDVLAWLLLLLLIIALVVLFVIYNKKHLRPTVQNGYIHRAEYNYQNNAVTSVNGGKKISTRWLRFLYGFFIFRCVILLFSIPSAFACMNYFTKTLGWQDGIQDVLYFCMVLSIFQLILIFFSYVKRYTPLGYSLLFVTFFVDACSIMTLAFIDADDVSIFACIVVATLVIVPNIVYVQKRKCLFFDSIPSQPTETMTKRIYKCGNCGRVGTYDGNCPVCGSSFKVYFDVPASADTTVQTAMPVAKNTPTVQNTPTAQNTAVMQITPVTQNTPTAQITPVTQPMPDVNHTPVNGEPILTQPTDTAGGTRPGKPMFCRRCGAKLKPDRNFCCKCGTKTKEE